MRKGKTMKDKVGPGLVKLERAGRDVFVFSRLPDGRIVRGRMTFAAAKNAVAYVESRAGNWRVGFPIVENEEGGGK